MKKAIRILFASFIIGLASMLSMVNTPAPEANASGATFEMQQTKVAIERTGSGAGVSPLDSVVAATDVDFNASSTPVRQCTPVSSGTTDIYGTCTNFGTASGNGIVYLTSRAVTLGPLPPGAFRHFYVQAISANSPVSLGGEDRKSVV